jgi:hypothetical protein
MRRIKASGPKKAIFRLISGVAGAWVARVTTSRCSPNAVPENPVSLRCVIKKIVLGAEMRLLPKSAYGAFSSWPSWAQLGGGLRLATPIG